MVQSSVVLSPTVMHIIDNIGWWRGVVGNAFRLKRSYSTPGPVSTCGQVNHLGAKPAN